MIQFTWVANCTFFAMMFVYALLEVTGLIQFSRIVGAGSKFAAVLLLLVLTVLNVISLYCEMRLEQKS